MQKNESYKYKAELLREIDDFTDEETMKNTKELELNLKKLGIDDISDFLNEHGPKSFKSLIAESSRDDREYVLGAMRCYLSLPEAHSMIPYFLDLGFFPIFMLIWQNSFDDFTIRRLCLDILYMMMYRCNVRLFPLTWFYFLGFSRPLPGTSIGNHHPAPAVFQNNLQDVENCLIEKKLLDLGMDKFAVAVLLDIMRRTGNPLFKHHAWSVQLTRCVEQLYRLFSNLELQTKDFQPFLKNPPHFDLNLSLHLTNTRKKLWEYILQNKTVCSLIDKDEFFFSVRKIPEIDSENKVEWFFPVLEHDFETVLKNGPSAETTILHADFGMKHQPRSAVYLTNSMKHAANVALAEHSMSLNELISARSVRFFIFAFLCPMKEDDYATFESFTDEACLAMLEERKQRRKYDDAVQHASESQDPSCVVAYHDDLKHDTGFRVGYTVYRKGVPKNLKLTKLYCFYK